MIQQPSRWLSLREYQSSHKSPLNNQLLLINNPNIFEEFKSVRCPFFEGKSIVNRLNVAFWKFRNLRNPDAVYIPDNINCLFLGYFNHSFDIVQPYLNQTFELISQLPEREFYLAIGKGDYGLELSDLELMPENLKRIYVNNLNILHPKAAYLPMGRDFRNLAEVKNLQRRKLTKDTLCYCNFSLNTHVSRKEIFELLVGKKFINFEHMGNFLEYSISRKQFLQRLGSSKFSICPRGNGLDTFRLWDSLYLGTIPIVVREAVFHNELEDLPILFLEKLTDFDNLTSEYLESVYEEYQLRLFNYSKLDIRYWLDKKAH